MLLKIFRRKMSVTFDMKGKKRQNLLLTGKKAKNA